MLVTTGMGGLVLGLIFWALLIGALIWLIGIARREYRRFMTAFENMCNTLDDSRRALQALNERFRTAEGLLESSSRMTSAALDANARALGAIREVLKTTRRS